MKSQFEVTELILGCCYEVLKEIGVGFLEVVYRNSLMIALEEKGLNVEVEKVYDVMFRNKRVGLYIADLVVNQSVIIEVKSCAALTPSHQSQLINYLAASGCPIGLLINFGNKRLEIKRLHHPNFRFQEEPVPF